VKKKIPLEVRNKNTFLCKKVTTCGGWGVKTTNECNHGKEHITVTPRKQKGGEGGDRLFSRVKKWANKKTRALQVIKGGKDHKWKSGHSRGEV